MWTCDIHNYAYVILVQCVLCMWVMNVRGALVLAMRPLAEVSFSHPLRLLRPRFAAQPASIPNQPAACFESMTCATIRLSTLAVEFALRSTSCRVGLAKFFVLNYAATRSPSRLAHAVLSRLIFSSNTPILAAMFGWPRIALPAPGGPDTCDACDAPDTVLRPA